MKSKVDGIDTSSFISRTKYEKGGDDFEDKIDKIDKKIPDITKLATKSSVTYLIAEADDKIDKADKKNP